MRLVMEPVLWDELGIDSPERYELALCCFYLGRELKRRETFCLAAGTTERSNLSLALRCSAGFRTKTQ